MKKSQIHKNVEGFTLIEMLITIVIIGFLSAIAIPQYNEYRIRGYDAHAKQALHDIYQLCNAYWIDTNPLETCDLSKIKATYYGFSQDPDVTNTLSPLPREKFCASAKHKDSTSTYSIDSVALISPGNCGGVESPVKEASLPTPPIDDDPPETTANDDYIAEILAAEIAEQTTDPPGETFETYSEKTAADQCKDNDNPLLGNRNHAFMMVEADGTVSAAKECRRMKELGLAGNDPCLGSPSTVSRSCAQAAAEINQIYPDDLPYGTIKDGGMKFVRRHYCQQQGLDNYLNDSLERCMDENRTRIVYVGPAVKAGAMGVLAKYDFETGTWITDMGWKFKNQERIE